MTSKELEDSYEMKLSDENRDYNYWDGMMIPVFCAAAMNLFGFPGLLNYYSKYENPRQFLTIVTTVAVTVITIIGVIGGYLGYIVFGNTVKSIIIYNLPNNDPLSIIAKFCFIINIIGSFILTA